MRIRGQTTKGVKDPANRAALGLADQARQTSHEGGLSRQGEFWITAMFRQLAFVNRRTPY
jgi:hypothetical protein